MTTNYRTAEVQKFVAQSGRKGWTILEQTTHSQWYMKGIRARTPWGDNLRLGDNVAEAIDSLNEIFARQAENGVCE